MRAREIRIWARPLLSVLTALALVSACGVDSGGTGAVAIGPIAGFGSIVVNGVRFDESGAAIRDEDGMPVSRDRLALGVMTEVDSSAPSLLSGVLRATADVVRVSSEVIGSISAVDPVASSLTVLGQTVLVTPATAFGPGLAGGLGSLAAGTVVEVHGRYDPANVRYTATRLELRPSPANYKLRGPISAVDSAHGRLTVRGQTIDYSGVPSADVANVAVGKIVSARLQPVTAGGVWIASALPSGAVQLPDSDQATLEGRVSAWTSSRQFSINGIAVDASFARFPHGQAGVVLGARVLVEGRSSAGVLRARTVDFEGDETAGNSLFELEGSIQAIDPLGLTFRVRGVTVDYSGPVLYESGSAANLAVGREVEVQGTLLADGMTIKAQKIAFD